MGIITLLGIGQTVFNFHNRFSDDMTKASFFIYMLHMPVLVVTRFFVLKLPICVAGQFFLTVLISAIVTIVLYTMIIQITRFAHLVWKAI